MRLPSLPCYTVLAVATLSLVPTAFAKPVEVEPGRQYSQGTRVQFSSFGVSFVIPSDWLGAMAPNGQAFLMGSNTKPGLVFATAEQGSSLAQLKAQMAQPVSLDEGTVLIPSGAPSVKGNKVIANFSAQAQGQTLKGYAEATVLEGGTAVGFFSLGPAGQHAYFGKLVRGLSKSLQKMSSKALAKASGDWGARLRGRALTYYNTSGGGTDKRHLSLCGDGTFYYSANTSYLSGGFSAAGQDANRGRWKIAGPSLQLSFQDGSTSSRRLSRQGSKTLVDGERWFVTNDARCQ